MKRLESIKKCVMRAYELESEIHYSLETGCDSWLELKSIYTNMSAEDIPILVACLERAVGVLEKQTGTFSDPMEDRQRALMARECLVQIEKELK